MKELNFYLPDFERLYGLNIEKIEILLNPICRLECQTRNLHYEFVSQKQLGIIPEDSHYKLCKCTKEHMMDSYVRYMIKPEYQSEVYKEIIMTQSEYEPKGMYTGE